MTSSIFDFFSPSPMTYEEALAQHPVTTRWLKLMHGGTGVGYGYVLVEAFAVAGVHPCVEAADRLLEHLESTNVISRVKCAPSPSQVFFDTKRTARSRTPEHVARASFFSWRPATGS